MQYRWMIAIVVTALLGFGCGSGEQATGDEAEESRSSVEAADASGEEATEPSAETEEAAETGQAEEPEAVEEEEPLLTAETIDSSEPIRADELRDAVLPLFGTPVVIEAYLFAPEEDENSLSFFQPLAAEPDQTDEDAELLELCSTSFGEDVGRDEPIYVRGSLPQRAYNYGEDKTVRLEDCEVLSAGEPPADAEVIPLGELYARTLGWIGKEVTVQGHFKGKTVSKVRSRTITVVDLAPSGEPGFGDIAVKCKLPAGESVPEAAEGNGATDIVRGVVTAENGFWDRVHLADCSFVNR